MVNEELLDRLMLTAAELLAEKGLTIVASLVVLAVGWKLINGLNKLFEVTLVRMNVEPLVVSFLSSLGQWTLRLLLLLSFASMLGVQTTSFLALLGSAGLAIGLALQGSLSNLAGGVLILLLKPFKIGDYIEAQGHAGTVRKIMLFHTQLNTPDNRVVLVPNGPLAGNSIMNYSAEPTRRLDYNIGISYGDDVMRAQSLLKSLAEADCRVLKDPAPQTMVASLDDSSVTIRLRLWVSSSDYWSVLFWLTQESKLLFDREGVTIPFPQRDIHLHQVENRG
jgi:small conductance mechanosensitive channel